ncbi:MAG TPA: fructose PTS transporter subunit IIA [Paenibacillus sp.]|uniref:PTS sugar transporter subunit IIA n=1 Tax=Paenibacillus sp. TaxID=58172 RepID=UPI0028D44C69|nr:fructose PTS transporter subunit IIA [Paenibacillus sp.]HUC92274.1 fructose PTS transporter subunit IIA [Paenibacillus sp.]
MNITALLDEKSIKIPLSAADKTAAIKALADGLEEAGCLSDKAAYTDAVLTRESNGSTGIGFGVAIPHGKSPGVTKAGLAFAKLSQPLEWQSLDGEPVKVVLLIAVPEAAASNEHLQILIAISRKLIDETFRNRLMEVSSADELKDLLGSI